MERWCSINWAREMLLVQKCIIVAILQVLISWKVWCNFIYCEKPIWRTIYRAFEVSSSNRVIVLQNWSMGCIFIRRTTLTVIWLIFCISQIFFINTILVNCKCCGSVLHLKALTFNVPSLIDVSIFINWGITWVIWVIPTLLIWFIAEVSWFLLSRGLNRKSWALSQNFIPKNTLSLLWVVRPLLFLFIIIHNFFHIE